MFVRVDKTLVQVVLSKFDPPVTVHANIQGKDLIDSAQELCSLNSNNVFHLMHPPLQFALVSGGVEEHALIIRLSHAQYDRICQHTTSQICALLTKTWEEILVCQQTLLCMHGR